jgi:hypothetical protein
MRCFLSAVELFWAPYFFAIFFPFSFPKKRYSHLGASGLAINSSASAETALPQVGHLPPNPALSVRSATWRLRLLVCFLATAPPPPRLKPPAHSMPASNAKRLQIATAVLFLAGFRKPIINNGQKPLIFRGNGVFALFCYEF